MGLAIASDIGITMQTLSLAVLLHARRMVSLASVDVRELGRCVIAGLGGGGAVWLALWLAVRALALHGQLMDASELLVGIALWLVVTGWLLETLGSALPRVALKRLRLA
uniref:Uncharacterized protein n=1 Tax=mine drainage metagenome TaxID=410659 RepID=E6PXB4_9ZZZZ